MGHYYYSGEYVIICNKKESNSGSDSCMVIPAGVEPAIFWMRTRRPRPLDDGTNTVTLSSIVRKSNRTSYSEADIINLCLKNVFLMVLSCWISRSQKCDRYKVDHQVLQ